MVLKMGVDETKGNEEEGEENEKRKKGDESGDECGWDRPLLLLPLLLTLIRGATNKETTQRSGGWCFFFRSCWVLPTRVTPR